ncbi:hypothetical protein RRG08_033427 [Elysia crispata]|uniref:Uncharacterized protein n=1 Tax=Elysia crispata TaxID=231223 RepID=A0AAE1ATQ9_9GAST|nr:hypothetical protein RRG08_033427 [Elysia crispata]
MGRRWTDRSRSGWRDRVRKGQGTQIKSGEKNDGQNGKEGESESQQRSVSLSCGAGRQINRDQRGDTFITATSRRSLELGLDFDRLCVDPVHHKRAWARNKTADDD